MASGSRLGIRCRSSSDGVGAGLKTCHGGAHLSAATKAELERVAALIATPGKGITACDEGPGTIGGRFEAVGLQNSEEARRSYRQMLFETEGSADYLCGAILDPETLYQRSSTDGALFPEKLSALGVVPGVKPHLKIYELPGQGGATVMQGLDSLAARCQEYAAAGAKFAKWRSPLAIDVAAGQPSSLTIQANMDDLARYALICQDNGLMPIVEPDISLKGCHDLETAVMVNVQVQSALYKSMLDHGVFMEGATLKPNIVNPGLDCEKAYTVEEIAKANIDVLNRCFPCSMKGANFLSGGQVSDPPTESMRFPKSPDTASPPPPTQSTPVSRRRVRPAQRHEPGQGHQPLEPLVLVERCPPAPAAGARQGDQDPLPGGDVRAVSRGAQDRGSRREGRVRAQGKRGRPRSQAEGRGQRLSGAQCNMPFFGPHPFQALCLPPRTPPLPSSWPGDPKQISSSWTEIMINCGSGTCG